MSLLSIYSKIQLKIEKAELLLSLEKRGLSREKPLSRQGRILSREKPLSRERRTSRQGRISRQGRTLFLKLRLLFWKTLKIIVRFLALIFNDSSENFLMFTRLNKDSVFVCNNSYCQYKKFQKRVRFFTKTAFAGILICTVIATSVLYLFLPGKPSSYAKTYNWVQSGWGGSANTSTFPNHTSNQTNWTDYYAKDSEVVIDGSGDLKLDYATGSWTETSDTDFGAGTTSQTWVSGTGDSASVKLEIDRSNFDCTGGTDHGGADWTVTDNDAYDLNTDAGTIEIAGKHCNIGTFTIATGTTVYVKAYDGASHGKVEIEADTINIIGTLNGDGRGYLGGAGGAAGVGNGNASPGNSGTNIGTYGGAGGAGGAGGGGDGGNGGSSIGTVYGSETSYAIDMGGGAGGGGGAWAYDGSGTSGDAGNSGGGAVFLYANDISVFGTITVNGGDGGSGGSGGSDSGGGGGGAGAAGGGILIDGINISVDASATITADSGSGGSGGTAYCNGSPGNSGGGGRIKFFYDTNDISDLATITATGYNNGTIHYGQIDATYFTPGTFTSQIHSVENSNFWDTMTWADSGVQTIGMKVRTSNSATMSGATDWASCDAITKGADISANNCVTDGDKYIQYQATLSTTDTTQTPSLESVTINYTLTTYPAAGSYTLTSSPYDTNSAENVLSGIQWTEDLPAGADWQYRKPITISPVTPEANYQVKVELTTSNFDYSKAKANGEDLRFYQTDETTKLDYWIESWDASGTSIIWVEVANSGTAEIYMYYGNSLASDASDGNATFEFFDDFAGASLDTDKWTIETGTPSVNDGLSLTDSRISTKTWTGNTSRLRYKAIYPASISGLEGIYNYGVAGCYFYNWASPGGVIWNVYCKDGSGSGSDGVSAHVGEHIIEIRKNSNVNAKFYIDDSLEVTLTSHVPNTAQSIYFDTFDSTTLEVNWVFAAQYDATDRTISVGAEVSGNYFDELKFQVRTAPDSSGSPGTWTNWCGPDDGNTGTCDTTAYFTDPTGAGETIDADLADGTNDQWIQYKAYLSSLGSATPTLSDVTMVYVINSPPTIAGVTATDSSTDGIIDIGYSISDEEEAEEGGEVAVSFLANTGATLNEELTIGDATAITVANIDQLPASGTIQIDNEFIAYTGKSGNDLTGITRGSITGNNTKAASHSSGAAVWIKGTTVTGDVGTITGVNSTPAAKTGTWDIKADLDGIYYATAIIRVSANDGNSANQVGNGDAAVAYTLDAKDPVLGTYPILIDASAGLDSATLSFDATDDTALQMMVSNNANLSADGVNADSGTWIDYAVTKTWILSTDPDTVYVQFKDSKGNIGGGAGTILSRESLPIPEYPMIQDISNLDALEFREFTAWKVSTVSDFQDYILESSTDDITYTTLQTITNQALNYYTHPSLTQDQDYYYRVYQQDTLGNKSPRTTVKHGRANGAQDFDEGGGGTAAGTDTTAPTITHNYATQVTSITSSGATITFTTGEMSDSYIGYSTDTTYANEQGVPTMIAGGETHTVTLVGLDENTQYHYKIKSRDPSGNTGTAQDDVNYVFTTTTDTDPPVITFDSSANITDITDSSAIISWTTDEVATSRVDYGTDTFYGSFETNANYNVDHSITLSNLTPATTYYFKLTSVDNSISANSATDDNSTAGYTFTTLASSDSTPPVISSVSTNSASYNSIAITWNTDENANSLIDFGTDTNYGTTQGNSSDSTTSHSVTLTGLAPETTYYYRVKSMDVSGNTAIDDNSDAGYTFTTTAASDPGDTTAPAISSVSSSSITSTGATITWTTDENSDSTVGFSLNTSFDQEQGTATATTSHSIALVNLAPETTYYYQVKSRDAGGNLGTDNNSGAGYSFTTLAGGDALAPIISDVTISDLTDHTAKISWTTNENSNSLIDYSQTSGVFTSTTGQYQDETISHAVTLRGLDPSTTYYLQARSIDASSNEGTDSNGGTGYTFTTTAGGDETPPEITAVSAGTPTYNSVTITWTTNELSNSLVDFGTSTSYGTTQGNSADSVTSHSVSLTGLSPSTVYYYRVKSIDTSGNLVSDDNSGSGYTFTTAAGADLGDTTAPVITFDSETGITNITSNSATISWTTNEDSDSTVGYGLSTSFNNEEGSATLTSSHSVTLNNLSSGTIYKFQIKSMDASGNLATENNSGAGWTFTTLAGGDSTAPIISNVSTGTCADTYCVVSWNTDENSSSLVDYGTVQGTYVSTGGNYKDEVIAHSVTLTSLTPETTYYYRVRSVDSNDNQAIDAGGTNGYSLTTIAAEESECPACPSCGGGGGSCPSVDTNPPTISKIKVSEITTNSAAVEWKTNEKGYSIVEYGADNSYGGIAGLYNNSVKNHIVSLSGLESGVVYHYRVASADSSGNLAQSEDKTFTTLSLEDLAPEKQKEEIKTRQETAAVEIQTKIEELLTQGMDEEEIRTIIARASEPPIIATEGPVVESSTNNSAKITWITDRKSNSVIRLKAKEEGIDPEESYSLKQYGDFKELTINHQVILSNLQSGTTYQYQVQSSDVLGNTSKSDWNEFTTQITPSIYDVLISEITLNSAVISWKTNIVSTSKVEYGETISYTDSIEDKDNAKVAKHLIKLNNLKSGMLYHFRVRGVDSENNNLVSDDYSFTTFTLPQIETYAIEEISERVIKLNWKTNVETDSAIKYTNLETNTTKIQGEDGMSSIHNFNLKGLNPGVEYLLQIQGRDIYGNQAITSEFTATTLADNTPPRITQVRTETAISSGKSGVVQTIISWKTNEPATSQILWEEGISKDEVPKNSTKEDENYTTNHIVVITTFKPSSVYRFRIQGKDKAGNSAQSQDFTILIPEKKKSVIQIIINNFEDTFGWMKKLGM